MVESQANDVGGGNSVAPGASDPLAKAESEKYRAVWAHDEYRRHSPGEGLVDAFVAAFNLDETPDHDRASVSVVDFGCGSGRPAKAISDQGFDVRGVDFASNALETDISFVEACLWDLPSDLRCDYALCTDVMEHIPAEKVDAVLASVAAAVHCGVLFQISTVPDRMGALIGKPLHLSVHEAGWWADKLKEFFPNVRRIDDASNAAVFVTGNHTQRVFISVTSNTADPVVEANIKAALETDIPTLAQVEAHNLPAVIVGGGPSLRDGVEHIKALARSGAVIYALNGAAKYLESRGINPDYIVVMDARPDNAAFLKSIRTDAVALLCSNCAPEVFAAACNRETVMWHTAAAADQLRPDQPYLGGGGTTVGIYALSLAFLMGHRRVHLFGYDSCFRSADGHAYSQDMNFADLETAATYRVGPNGREFLAAPWMAAQANEFRNFICRHGRDIAVTVYGDGLIPEIAKLLSGHE